MLTRAVLLGRMRRYDEALAIIDRSAADGNGRLGPNELLEKGRLLDQLGRYDDAWAAFAEGKRLARELSGQAYLDDEARQQIERLRSFFTAGRLRLLPRAARALGRAAADLHPRLPALRHHAGRADAVGASAIAAGDELPLIHEITAIMPRMLASPLGYPEALAELWMGDQREGLDNLRDYYLQKVRQMGVLRDGRHAVHRQDAAERDASRPDRAAVPRGAADPCAAPSARHHGVGVLQPVHPRLLLRL